jgi:hypothetical protein
MYRNKMNVIGTIALALSLTVGFLVLSATNVAFAADKSALPSSLPQLVGDRVPGWCNWDGDQDKDDWCWQTISAKTTGNGYVAPTGNGYGGYTAPRGNGTIPAGTVVPYGVLIGQSDPTADGYMYGGYNNNYMGNYNNMYRYNYLYPRRLYFNRDPDDRSLMPPFRFFRRNMFFYP